MSLPTILSIYDPVDRRTAAMCVNEYKYSIRIAPETTPVLQVSDYIELSDEFRAEMNQWLLTTFGNDTDVPHGYVHVNHKLFELVMSKRTYDTLRNDPAASQLPTKAGWSSYA